jgi:serine/threonine-protein kinase
MTISDLAHDQPPAIDGAYEIVRELGRGGMAVVYLVRERATGQERAIKVIHSRFLGDAEAVARFAREAKLVGSLEHPNVVPLVAVEKLDGGGIALVMEHVPGRTLKQTLRDEGPLSVALTKRVLDDIASALAYAHARGIVHRDVKPENIFIDETTGRALLSDFGIARSMESETQLTMAGVAIGTPTYMAPEQIDGDALDGRSDLYSLGLVAWEMLTGKRPWDGETLYNIIYHQKHDELPPIDTLRLDAPPNLLAAIEGLLEKSPEARWASAAEFRSALHADVPRPRRVRHDSPVSSHDTSGDTVALDRASIAAPQHAADVADGGVARHALRRYGPVTVAAALLVSATLLFARSEPNTDRAVSLPHATPTGDVAARQIPVHARPAPSDPAAGGSASAGGDVGPMLEGVVVPPPADSLAAEAPRPAPTPTPSQPVEVPKPAPAITAKLPVTVTLPPAAPRESAAPVVVPRSVVSDAGSGARMSVAVGAAHTCLLSSNGATYCWGGNAEGQLGTGALAASTVPMTVGGSPRFTRIVSGAAHTCALASGGAAFCWGANDDGELGDGTTTSRAAPTRVAGGRTFIALSAGASHTCALTSDGRVWCWGAGARGQLGNGATTDRAAPVLVNANARFTDVVTGWNHTCALTDAGVAYCWGANATGAVGDGSTSDRANPMPVRTPLRFIALTAGSGHTCGIATSGAAYCWGQDRYGQLGDGGTATRLTPTPVDGDLRFTAISAGGVSTCALTRDHQAWCWGRNVYGQLGDGTNTDRTRPARVAGDHDFAQISTFGAHACATTTTSELFCWGYNLDGQLGDGSRDHRNRPVYVERPAG